jgi:hypothetical protein
MLKLNLPSCTFRTQTIEGKNFIFDILRKKFVLLTPEEWVRQHFVHLLIYQYHYPKALIKLEGGLRYNELKKRSDIVVYDREGCTFLIVECKSADVLLSQKVFEQVTTYNHTIKAKYVVITNGIKHFCCSVNHENGKVDFMADLPVFC